MVEGRYRVEAARTLRAAAAVSALTLIITGLAFLAGSRALRQLATTLAHACLRIWAALPDILQIALGIIVGIGVLSGALWLLSSGKRWRLTAGLVRSVRAQAVEPPSSLLRLCAKHALTRRVVVFDDARALAFTVGLIAPRIMISTALIGSLEEDELEAVLLHEQSHLQNRDPLYLLLSRTLATALFYLPVVRALAQRHQATIELAADEYVIATQGGAASLSSAMVKLLRLAPSTLVVNYFTGLADLRLSYLLGENVNLPSVSPRSSLQTCAVVAAIVMPAGVLYGLAGALNAVSFAARCIV